jgi:transmembrane sensor
MESSRQIEDRAAEWLAHRDSGRWSDADQRELETWLAASFEHRVAFLRLEAAWEKTKRAKAFGVGVPARMVPPPGEWRTTPFFGATNSATSDAEPVRDLSKGAVRPSRNARRMRWGIAASVLLAASAALYFYSSVSSKDHYSTPVGGTASIPLKDGTKVTLNTASEIRIDLSSKDLRRVDLEQGEAFFDVAKDPARPFTVFAGDKRITAVGTRFAVRRDADGDVRVTVTEGTVRFDSGEGERPPADAGMSTEQRPVLLLAGTIARATKDSLLVQKDAAQAAESSLSWRSGYLIFDDTALADAVAEFNRYTREPIRIEDPGVAAIRISGKFRSDGADVFLRLLHDGYSIDSRSDNGAVLLVRAK